MKFKLFLLLLLITSLLCSCGFSAAKTELSATRFLESMDTVMTLTAYGDNCAEALDAAQAEIQRLDALLSTGSASSEISQLNSRGSAVLSEDSRSLMMDALRLYRETEHTFDVTVYPLTCLWGFSDKNYRVPSWDELEHALTLVGSDRLEYDAASGALSLQPGQAIDFGGIAKGYTSQRVMNIFRSHGISSGIISLGGNVHCLGTKPDGSDWRIGIRDPWGDADSLYAVLSVSDRAVITSGGYERYFVDDATGRTYRHILDPRTGYPAENGLASVTIVTEDGTLGDALSTALYVMGPGDAADYWRSHSEQFEAVLIDVAGEICVTPGIAGSVASEHPVHVIPIN